MIKGETHRLNICPKECMSGGYDTTSSSLTSRSLRQATASVVGPARFRRLNTHGLSARVEQWGSASTSAAVIFGLLDSQHQLTLEQEFFSHISRVCMHRTSWSGA